MENFDEAPASPRRWRAGPSMLRVVLVSELVSAAVTVAIHVLFVPAGLGWRKLEHEGTVSVHGNNRPLTVHYPSRFTRPPSLTVEVAGPGSWFYRVDEQTESHFVITNTTVDKRDGTPVVLQVKWKSQG